MIKTRGVKTRCGGKWTQAKYNSFVKSALRGASRKWQPIQACLREARVGRGQYLCAGCKETVPVTAVVNGKRSKNIYADHIEPIVPVTGWEGWDSCVERMFCELDGLQALCKPCHDTKSKEEAAARAFHRAEKKNASKD